MSFPFNSSAKVGCSNLVNFRIASNAVSSHICKSIDKISFTLEKGECLGIIGKNGKGKSTLLNTIAGELKQLSGQVDFHGSTSFAHFGQTNIAHLSDKNTVMDEIYVGNPKLSEANVRSICGGMMFSGDAAKKKISLLSGGEKSRVMLGQIIARNVNLLFLDELEGFPFLVF